MPHADIIFLSYVLPPSLTHFQQKSPPLTLTHQQAIRPRPKRRLHHAAPLPPRPGFSHHERFRRGYRPRAASTYDADWVQAPELFPALIPLIAWPVAQCCRTPWTLQRHALRTSCLALARTLRLA